MAAAETASGPIEVVPFARLTTGALSGVLQAQRTEWLATLGWDIAGIVEFVETAIAGRSLRGSAVLVDGVVVGFGFFTVEIDRCLIGEVYVQPDARSADVHDALVEGIIRQIRQTRPRKRVESQSIVFDPRGFDEAFARHGFERHERTYMAKALDAVDEATDHVDVDIRPWRDIDFSPALEVVYQSYRGTVDAQLNVQYRSREGCADLLDALTDSMWCGRFDPTLARIAQDRATGRCCGVVIASAIGPETSHLGQISVLPSHQHRGVGRAMIAASLVAARAAGFERTTLAVTSANTAASKLYEVMGFAVCVPFPVYTRETAPFRVRPRST